MVFDLILLTVWVVLCASFVSHLLAFNCFIGVHEIDSYFCDPPWVPLPLGLKVGYKDIK